MGTRHLTLVQLGGTYKVAQYGQWDGYPEGQGQRVVNFLQTIKTKKALAEFTKKVAALVEISPAELEARWASVGADGSGLVGMEVADAFKAKWPHFSRDCGAEILNLVASGKAKEVSLDADFAKDSLFCEWAYLIDLDAGTFEVFKGFNKRPLPKNARFYFDGYKSEPHQERDKEFKVIPGKFYHYYPIRLKKKYSLKEIPSLKTFFKDMGVKLEKSA